MYEQILPNTKEHILLNKKKIFKWITIRQLYHMGQITVVLLNGLIACQDTGLFVIA